MLSSSSSLLIANILRHLELLSYIICSKYYHHPHLCWSANILRHLEWLSPAGWVSALAVVHLTWRQSQLEARNSIFESWSIFKILIIQGTRCRMVTTKLKQLWSEIESLPLKRKEKDDLDEEAILQVFSLSLASDLLAERCKWLSRVLHCLCTSTKTDNCFVNLPLLFLMLVAMILMMMLPGWHNLWGYRWA